MHHLCASRLQNCHGTGPSSVFWFPRGDWVFSSIMLSALLECFHLFLTTTCYIFFPQRVGSTLFPLPWLKQNWPLPKALSQCLLLHNHLRTENSQNLLSQRPKPPGQIPHLVVRFCSCSLLIGLLNPISCCLATALILLNLRTCKDLDNQLKGITKLLTETWVLWDVWTCMCTIHLLPFPLPLNQMQFETLWFRGNWRAESVCCSSCPGARQEGRQS